MAKNKDIKALTKEELQKIKKADVQDTAWLRKDVKFLIYIPPELHKTAKKMAFDNEMSLHDYIIQCVKIVTDIAKKK